MHSSECCHHVFTFIYYSIQTHTKSLKHLYLCPPLKKEGHIALHMSVGRSVGRSVRLSVGMSVSLNLVQLITQEGFAPEASNLVGR